LTEQQQGAARAVPLADSEGVAIAAAPECHACGGRRRLAQRADGLLCATAVRRNQAHQASELRRILTAALRKLEC
jgi:hypothetical protein